MIIITISIVLIITIVIIIVLLQSYGRQPASTAVASNTFCSGYPSHDTINHMCL